MTNSGTSQLSHLDVVDSKVSLCLYVATLGGYLWDVAINMENDYQLLFKHRIRYPTVIYYTSRIFTLAYILAAFACRIADVPNCNAMYIAMGICNVLCQTFTSLLFFFRVTAARSLFLSAFVARTSEPDGTTQQCIVARVPESIQLSVIMPLIFDSCIFIAVTYRILLYSCIEETTRGRLRAFFGKGVPIVSRNLLLSGQQYYLVAVCGNIVCLVFVLVPGFPAVYRAMCTLPILAIINAMACIVFRKIKFGLITSEGTMMVQLSTFHATSGPAGTTSLHRSVPIHGQPSHTDGGSPTLGAEYQEAKGAGTGPKPLELRMMQETAGYNDNFPVKSSPLEV
ncbi:hypothetical protein IW262DRAFT_1540854 [Armillaria fumosa]|nr:hypothetical protein IW262DRAFT_1540854 [Armillaria fumosa]